MCACDLACACTGVDLFLPTRNSRPEKKKRLPHPFHGVSTRKNGKGYASNLKQKDISTQYLSASDFVGEINSYVSNLSREDCCVSISGEARKCKCIQFLADKPGVIKSVSLGLKMYFNPDDSNRKIVLGSEQRQADRPLKHCKRHRMIPTSYFCWSVLWQRRRWLPRRFARGNGICHMPFCVDDYI